MCYDISLTSSIKKLEKYFANTIMDDQLNLDFDMAHNMTHIIGHAHSEHPVFYIPTNDTLPHGKLMEWGVIPFYVKDELAYKKQRSSMLNIRSERILNDTKSYWFKIKNRRCLIPITGFYEHREVAGFTKKNSILFRPESTTFIFCSRIVFSSRIAGQNNRRND